MINFERIIFYSLLISIPIQLGKHFWPTFSFVQGIRVDYLSPTFYLTDFLIILLFIVSIKRLSNKLFLLFKKPLFLSFLILLFISTLTSFSKEAAFFGIIKFLEMFFFAFYVALSLKKEQLKSIIFVFTLGGVIQVAIIILQFFSQSSIGGLFYFLGERTFSISTIGIAAFNFNNELISRPYGTFPHPNVAAFYLFICFSLVLFSIDFKKRYEAIFKGFVALFLTIGIIFTFSRIIYVILFLTFVYWLFEVTHKFKTGKTLITGTIAFFLVLFIFLFPRLGGGIFRDSLLRLDLLEISFLIFLKNPIFGVGINNFYYHEIFYQKEITPTLLQPVHNIYFLILNYLGIFGLTVVFIFLFKTFQNVKKHPQILVFFLAMLFVGLFDHYLITLQQGQLMLSFIMGLCYSKVKNFTV